MEALPPVRQKDYRWLELASMLSPALWTTQTGRGEQRTRQRSKGRPERGTVASGASTRDSARTVSAASRLVSLACRREQRHLATKEQGRVGFGAKYLARNQTAGWAGLSRRTPVRITYINRTAVYLIRFHAVELYETRLLVDSPL